MNLIFIAELIIDRRLKYMLGIIRRSLWTDTIKMSSPARLLRLEGLDGRSNDVVTVGEPERCNKLLVFFGGDVQDLEEMMARHRDNKRYVEWSLERTAGLLARADRDCLVAVVRPARIERGTFSCYDNFVPSNSVGSPQHCDDHGALSHLSLLLHQLQSPLTLPVCLVGFSKGVVVLNQLVREMSRQVRWRYVTLLPD